MIRPELAIVITALHDGAAIRFPKDRDLIARFRQRFSAARWGVATRSWHIPGKLAASRAEKWADDERGYLLRLEQMARDSEWLASAGQTTTKPEVSDRPPRSGSYIHLTPAGPVDKYGPGEPGCAIPGQPSFWAHPMPPEEPDRARDAIRKLAETIAARKLFGFLESPKVSIVRYWPPEIYSAEYPPPPTIDMWCDGALCTRGRGVSLNWTWTRLWLAGDGRYADGWHPGSNYFALDRSWAVVVWNALNPGKRNSSMRYP